MLGIEVSGLDVRLPVAIVLDAEGSQFDDLPGLVQHPLPAGQEGDRLVTVDQIVDVAIAVELADTARNRSAASGF